MSVSYHLHTMLALWSVLLGVFLGFCYEFFRFAHRLHPGAVWLIFLEDLLFSGLCLCGMLLLFFNLSYGRMRLYAFVGVPAGFILWYFTLGRLFRLAFMRLVAGIKARLRPPLTYARARIYTCVCGGRLRRYARRGFGIKKTFRRKLKDDTS